MQKSKANQMVPSILPENLVLASKNCVKVKNERFSLGFTVGQGLTIPTPPTISYGVAKWKWKKEYGR